VAASPDRDRLSILGVPLDLVGADEAGATLYAFLTDPWDGRCRHVVTLNPEYVMMARRHAEFANGIRDADLIVADGVGVVAAARLLAGVTNHRVERVTGTDLVEWLATESETLPAPLFLLGGAAGVAEAAAHRLASRVPAARIAGCWGGGTASEADDEETLALIRESGARAVLVAYGASGQVLWIERNRTALAAAGVRLAIGIGGVLDFLAGTVPRAPSVVRRAGLEWLYRLIREPWRWRRQAVLPVFSIRVLIEWLWRRGNRAGKIARPKSS
jgi:N-acetylglucosaminyldiphosphoundecaprenol N-acetyl-beta-D-mannosaminyltransferase